MTIEHVARWIRRADRVVYLVGAGLSVPSGIRAYRSGKNAVWGEHVLEWGTRQRFLDDPLAWWKTFWLGAHADLFRDDVHPNAGHEALVELVGRDPRDLVITQNIDGLHRRAGHPESQLVEIHGRHDRFVCSSDGGCRGIDHPLESVDLSRLDEGVVPRCARCDEPMRPLVLLFDERYDGHAFYQAHRARRALDDASVIVFVGTSFSVGITASAMRSAQVSGARMVNVNPEPAPFAGVTELTGSAHELLPALAHELTFPTPERDTLPPPR